MSVNRNANKIFQCIRIQKDKPDIPLEEFEVKDKNTRRAISQLNKRFFLYPDETWKIIRRPDLEKIYRER